MGGDVMAMPTKIEKPKFEPTLNVRTKKIGGIENIGLGSKIKITGFGEVKEIAENDYEEKHYRIEISLTKLNISKGSVNFKEGFDEAYEKEIEKPKKEGGK